MRGLERAASVSLSTITHHLRVLESEGSVVGISDGHYRRFFMSSLTLPEQARRLSEDDRKLLAECKRPTSLAIILNLAADGPLRHREIEERVRKRKGTVSYYLSRLQDLGDVASSSDSSRDGYIVGNASRVIPLLVTFSSSRRDRVDTYANLWLVLGRKSR